MSCSAPQRVTPAYLKALDRLSAACDVPYNMHILETRSQRVFGSERYGRSLVRYAQAQGVLSDRAHVIHAIWIDDEDIAVLAGDGVKIAHNPTCNLRLGSGIMRWRDLADAGVPIGIGTDEANVDDGVNFWSAVKNTGLVHNITTPEYRDWPDAGRDPPRGDRRRSRRPAHPWPGRPAQRRSARRRGAHGPRHPAVHPAQRHPAPAGLLRARPFGDHGDRRRRGRRRRRRVHPRR